jgi:hypothetical protein
MAMVTYPWNPFQERVDCIITPPEVIKPSGQNARREFVPRYAPFFAKDFKLTKQGSNTPLVPGVDYAFAHPFKEFVTKYRRNVYGSVVLLKNFTEALTATYSTIGTPFVLNEVAYGELVANIANSPRQAFWDDLTGVPTEWPAPPHEHPATLTFDYMEMMERLENMILVMAGTEAGTGEMTVKQLLEEHMAKDIPFAHGADAADLGLDKVANVPQATIADLAGNSNNNTVSIAVLKEAFRLAMKGQLDLN